MLKIRLQRFGRRNQPAFRVVLVDSRRGPQTGNVKEILGSFHPKTKELTLQKDSILDWIKKGAQVSDRVHNMLIKEGILQGAKKDVASKKNVGKKEEEARVAAEAEAEKKAAEESTEEATQEPAPEAEAEKTEEAPAESAPEEKTEEAPADETEAPTEEPEEKKE